MEITIRGKNYKVISSKNKGRNSKILKIVGRDFVVHYALKY